jgi:hypothetical protein
VWSAGTPMVVMLFWFSVYLTWCQVSFQAGLLSVFFLLINSLNSLATMITTQWNGIYIYIFTFHWLLLPHCLVITNARTMGKYRTVVGRNKAPLKLLQ